MGCALSAGVVKAVINQASLPGAARSHAGPINKSRGTNKKANKTVMEPSKAFKQTGESINVCQMDKIKAKSISMGAGRM